MTLERSPLMLKRGSATGTGHFGPDDYDVLENGEVVGRIFLASAGGPDGRPWMWASGHNGDYSRAAHGFEATREDAMAAFAKSWRGEKAFLQVSTPKKPR